MLVDANAVQTRLRRQTISHTPRIRANPVDGERLRRAARLLLVDEARTHTLLVLAIDPRRPLEPFWLTVGGGIERGETPREAAAREAREEIGFVVDPADLQGPFAPEVVEFSFDGTSIHQAQEFYIVVAPRFVPAFLGIDDVERRSTLRVSWIPIRDLAALDEPVHPAHLADILATWRAIS